MDSTPSPTNIKVSVLCVTNRPGAVPILRDNLAKQTFKDFELVVVNGVVGDDDLDPLTELDCEWKLLPDLEAKNPQLTSVPFNLGQAYNQGIRECRGEYIFCLQDYIWIPANAIEKFLSLMEEKTLVIGVGHKAKYPETLNGDFTKKPTGISEVDDRLISNDGEIITTNYSQFELNYAMAPKQMFYDVGGLEESFDNTFYGADNTALAFKAEMMGYKFLIDKSNECVGYNQSLFPRPHDWEQRHNNKGNYNAWARKASSGDWKRYL